jgi:CheY-like chemotaxis protein
VTPWLEGLRVLVVEDHADSADVLRQMVEAFGARVTVAGDGRAALEAIGRERPGVVLCDLLMPRMDGFALVAKLRAHPAWHALPVVAITALGGDENYRRTWEAGFDSHLTKPIEPAQLAAVIEAVRHRPPRGG